MARAVEPYYPRNPDGAFPWGYLWGITIPCDREQCGRRFPLVGSLTLRHPYRRTNSVESVAKLDFKDVCDFLAGPYRHGVVTVVASGAVGDAEFRKAVEHHFAAVANRVRNEFTDHDCGNRTLTVDALVVEE